MKAIAQARPLRLRGTVTAWAHRSTASLRDYAPAVLVTKLDTGALVIEGRPDGPRAYLDPDDAAPLKQELAAAFECAEQPVPGNDSETR